MPTTAIYQPTVVFQRDADRRRQCSCERKRVSESQRQPTILVGDTGGSVSLLAHAGHTRSPALLPRQNGNSGASPTWGATPRQITFSGACLLQERTPVSAARRQCVFQRTVSVLAYHCGHTPAYRVSTGQQQYLHRNHNNLWRTLIAAQMPLQAELRLRNSSGAILVGDATAAFRPTLVTGGPYTIAGRWTVQTAVTARPTLGGKTNRQLHVRSIAVNKAVSLVSAATAANASISRALYRDSVLVVADREHRHRPASGTNALSTLSLTGGNLTVGSSTSARRDHLREQLP